MIHPESFILENSNCKYGKYDKGDHFLNDFELNQ